VKHAERIVGEYLRLGGTGNEVRGNLLLLKRESTKQRIMD